MRTSLLEEEAREGWHVWMRLRRRPMMMPTDPLSWSRAGRQSGVEEACRS